MARPSWSLITIARCSAQSLTLAILGIPSAQAEYPRRKAIMPDIRRQRFMFSCCPWAMSLCKRGTRDTIEFRNPLGYLSQSNFQQWLHLASSTLWSYFASPARSLNPDCRTRRAADDPKLNKIFEADARTVKIYLHFLSSFLDGTQSRGTLISTSACLPTHSKTSCVRGPQQRKRSEISIMRQIDHKSINKRGASTEILPENQLETRNHHPVTFRPPSHDSTSWSFIPDALTNSSNAASCFRLFSIRTAILSSGRHHLGARSLCI